MNSALDEELASGEEISSERTNNGDFQGREISATVNDQKPIGEGSDEFSGEVNVGHRTLARGPDDPGTLKHQFSVNAKSFLLCNKAGN